ncbi:hypothetical protein TREES_T100010021 [Tupaia chinensis]|uniref:Uncharacterized protein n=1 Tax=Tupaia chinensis TaxID=246437 RepID=L9KK02_TUPCH|nr:hypothetical protein TREES_T100010021 [Tupaia chinensis]
MTSPLRSGVWAGGARTFTSPDRAAAGPQESRRLPTRAPGSPSLRWRRRQLAHAPPPALLGVMASRGGSGPACGKQEGEGSSDLPVQLRRRSPEVPGKAIGGRDQEHCRHQKTEKSGGTSGPLRLPAPEMTLRRRRRPLFKVNSSPAIAGLFTKWQG